jgi:hypothetical protein
MLSHESGPSGWSSIGTSQALEVLLAFFNNCTVDTVNLSDNLFGLESMTLNSQNLSTSRVSLTGINRIDSGYCLSLVASLVVIRASNRRGFHVHGIAYTESEHDIGRGVWSNGSHLSSHIYLGVSRENSIFFNETFKVYSVTIETDFNKGELRQCRALLLLSLSWVNPERDFRVRVHHRRSN